MASTISALFVMAGVSLLSFRNPHHKIHRSQNVFGIVCALLFPEFPADISFSARPSYVHSRGDLCIRYVKEESFSDLLGAFEDPMQKFVVYLAYFELIYCRWWVMHAFKSFKLELYCCKQTCTILAKVCVRLVFPPPMCHV